VKGFSLDLEDGVKGVLTKYYEINRFLRTIFSYRSILISSVIFLLFVNVYIFLFTKTQISYAAIQKGDNQLSELVRLTKMNSIPEKTIILTVFYSTQAGFYLPDYLIYCPLPLMFSPSDVPINAQNVYISFRHQTTPKTYWIPTGFEIQPITVPTAVDTVILWEEGIAEFYQNDNRPLKKIRSNGNDTAIYLLKLLPGDKFIYNYHYLTVK
jgi:hypothetical protein